MSGASCSKTVTSDNRENANELLVDTFYYSLPFNLSSMEKRVICLADKVKPSYINMTLEFWFERVSECHFKIYFQRRNSYQMPDGDYKLEFHCNINVFDEDGEMCVMRSHELEAEVGFVLKSSDGQAFSSRDLQKQFEFKILVKLIEYDFLLNEKLETREKKFREKNPKVYNNRSLYADLCYIFNVQKFEDIFRGRLIMLAFSMKIPIIQRTVTHAEYIANYLRRKNASIAPSFEDLKEILKIVHYIANGQSGKEGTITDDKLIKIYDDAHYLGLPFLRELSRDCLLYRLTLYEGFAFPREDNYENYMFLVLNAAANVNDDDLLHGAEMKLKSLKAELFNFEALLGKLKNSDIRSRFVIHCLKKRFKNQESSAHFEGDSSSRFFELL